MTNLDCRDQFEQWSEGKFLLNELVKLTGDASPRQYWRLPKGLGIFCYDPNSESLSNFIEIQSYLDSNNIFVPEIIASSKEQKCLWLSDLGNQTLLLEISQASEEHEYHTYRKLIDIILKLQTEGSHIPPIVKQRSFDREKYLFEINMTLEYFCLNMLKLNQNQVSNILTDFKGIIDKLISHPQVFTHRDFHSRNIMLCEEKLFVIDFQDARMGIPHYDLVSLLEDCYVDISGMNKQKLISYYWERRNKDNFHYTDKETFMEFYDLMLLQRVFKAIGSFNYIYQQRGDIRYLKYIGFAMEKIRRSLRNLEGCESLSKHLLGAYYES